MAPRHESPLDGAFNFRDLGGLPTPGGRTVARGKLFRSDTLQALSERDVALLRDQIGLRVVVDLRLAHEVHDEGRGPLAAEAAIGYVHAPLQMASTAGIAPDQVLEALYLQCLASPSTLHAVERIAAHAGEPTLFHCAAGKDRTGVVAALVLGLLSVDDEVIVADYLDSAPNMPRMLARFAGWPRYRDHLAAMPPQVYAVQEAPIRSMLQALREQHGTAREWAIKGGIAAASIDRLRSELITPQVHR
jgi:protein-tyrosine phosphatase